MDRIRKTNILMRDASSEEILRRLVDAYPEELNRYSNLLRYERLIAPGVPLRWTLFPLSLLLLGFLGSSWPPLSIPSFAGQHAGVVIAGSWLPGPWSGGALDALCGRVEQIDSGGFHCVRTSLLSSRGQIRQKAVGAGAVLLATVERGGTLTITPLVHPSMLPLDDLPPMRLSPSDGAAEVLDALRRVLAGEREGCEGRLPVLDHPNAEFALLGDLLDWVCHGGRFSTRGAAAAVSEREHRLCRGRSPHTASCALARYLAAQALECRPEQRAACQPALSALKELAQLAPDERIRRFSQLELVRRTCDDTPDEAAAELLALAARIPEGDPCEILLPLGPGACLRFHPRLRDDLRRKIALLDENLVEKERALHCHPTFVASLLGERGNHLLRAGRWDLARSTFEVAQQRYGDPVDALNVAEALLLAGRPQEARKYINPDIQRSPMLRAHAAFLMWLTSRSETDARQLEQFYNELPASQMGVLDGAGTIARFASRDSRTLSVYAILNAGKMGRSYEDLRNALLIQDHRP